MPSRQYDTILLANHKFASKIWSQVTSKMSMKEASGGQEGSDDSIPKRCQATRGASSGQKSAKEQGDGLAARRTPSISKTITKT